MMVGGEELKGGWSVSCGRPGKIVHLGSCRETEGWEGPSGGASFRTVEAATVGKKALT